MKNLDSNVRYSVQLHDALKLERSHIIEAHGAVAKWQERFKSENTGVYREFKVPSLVVRVDCAPNKALNVIGVKSGPGGVGLMNKFHPKMKYNLKKIRAEWPTVGYVESPAASGKNDSYLWLDKVATHDIRRFAYDSSRSVDLVFINAADEELAEYGYMNASASPLFNRGDKQYGEGWLWKNVSPSDIESLNWKAGFSIKSRQSSNMKGVYIYYPNRSHLNKLGLKGSSTRNQIHRALLQEGVMYYQPFVKAVFKISEQPTVLSLFFLYSPVADSFIYSGGLSISRPNLKVASVYGATIGLVN